MTIRDTADFTAGRRSVIAEMRLVIEKAEANTKKVMAQFPKDSPEHVHAHALLRTHAFYRMKVDEVEANTDG